MLVPVGLLGIVFYQFGGQIQKIVTSKTDTTDVRAATIIDFIYGMVLLVFKEWSDMPMSTTWVFLGVLAGREFALSMYLADTSGRATTRKVLSDASKAFLGARRQRYFGVRAALGCDTVLNKGATDGRLPGAHAGMA